MKRLFVRFLGWLLWLVGDRREFMTLGYLHVSKNAHAVILKGATIFSDNSTETISFPYPIRIAHGETMELRIEQKGRER